MEETMLDLSGDFGARVARRLEQEEVIWLTTVRGDLTPQPSPVWFLWDGATLLVYSEPNTPKLRNIARSPAVALNLNCSATGGDVVILTATAQLDEQAPPATGVAAYIDKYRAPIARIGMTPESFAQAYSVALRLTPTGLRGH
jgi:PPOX class probable F420-dependent enzyme